MLRMAILCLCILMSGCAWDTTTALVSVPTTPVSAGPAVEATKTGEAVCWNILGIAAFGDCSVETAKKNGGISQVATVDQKNLGIIGILYRTTIIVKGK